jgi:hypothetical protein
MPRAKLVCFFMVCGFAFLVATTPARSQAGYVTVWGDPELTACHVQDNQVNLVEIYVAHQGGGPAQGVRFRVDVGAANLVYLRQVSPYLTLGQSVTGVSVCYDACLESPGLILTVQFLGQGFTPPCTFLEIAEHPEDDHVLVLDCDANVLTAGGGFVIVNQNSTCICQIGPDMTETRREADTPTADFCYWVPVEQTTWGMIKSLYP